jgi:Phosphoesterase family
MATVPAYKHIVVVVEENHNYDEIAGNTAQAPFINSLMAGGANLTNFTALAHPSQPNYFALYAGSTFGTTDDNPHSEPDPSLYTTLHAAGRSFQGYVDEPGGSDFNHDPWVSFPEGYSVQTDFSSFPALFPNGDYSSLPSVSFVIPGVNNDMHNGTIAVADAWLRSNLGAYVQWAVNNDSLLVVVGDENDNEAVNQVPCILYGANIVPGNYNTSYNDYNLLSTITGSFGLTAPNNAATAATIQVFGTPPATVAQYLAAKSSYDQIPGGFAIADTAANITTYLDQLSDPKINTITISDNGSIGVSVAQLTSDAAAIGKLQNANKAAYQLKISDSASAVIGDLNALNRNAHVVSITAISGTTTLQGGAVVSAPAFGLTGSTTVLTLAENLTYSGSFTEGAGSTLSIASGDTLTLKGKSSLVGTVNGAGALALAGGITTIAGGAKLSVAKWSISGAGTNATLSEALSYSGAFSEGAGATLNLTGGALTLGGSAKFAGGTVKGSRTIYTEGTTTVSGLTIGGTATWNNAKMVTHSGGNVTVGDGGGAAAILANAATGTYDITDNSGIGRGSSTASSIANAGLFEKTGGTLTSAITPKINNTGTIAVSSGALDLQGALSGTGNVQIGKASTLEVDSTVGAGQTFTYKATGGDLKLDDLYSGGSQLFHGTISGFGAGDSIDAGVPFGTGTTFIYTENLSGTGGVLALTDGLMHASINFLGNYSAANFLPHTDSHGGTLFTYHR